jgi:hypothetical protein
LESCQHCHLHVSQWLFTEYSTVINIHDQEDLAFISAGKTNLELAQWLYQLGGGNIHAWDNHLIQWGFYSRQGLPLIQWLHVIREINIHNNNQRNHYFELACEHGHVELIESCYNQGVFKNFPSTSRTLGFSSLSLFKRSFGSFKMVISSR